MKKFSVRPRGDDHQKTSESTAEEASLPVATLKKANWPFLVAQIPVTKANQAASEPAYPS